MFRPDTLTMSAYLDGELDPETAAEIEVAAARDPELRQRLDGLLRVNAMVRVAYDEPLHEPVPDDLLAAINNCPAPARSQADNVIPLRTASPRVRRASAAWATAAAAAVALVIGAGGALLTTSGTNETQTALTGETRTAVRQFVNEALETLPNGQQAPIEVDNRFIGSVTPLRTYVNAEGIYCRDYVISMGLNSGTSTACRVEPENWRETNGEEGNFGRI